MGAALIVMGLFFFLFCILPEILKTHNSKKSVERYNNDSVYREKMNNESTKQLKKEEKKYEERKRKKNDEDLPF